MMPATHLLAGLPHLDDVFRPFAEALVEAGVRSEQIRVDGNVVTAGSRRTQRLSSPFEAVAFAALIRLLVVEAHARRPNRRFL